MVVEDDHDIRVTLRALLEAEGYTVLSAGNGKDALDILESSADKPGLVLIDLMMPIMDGWQLVALMKADATLAGIPFAIQSAYADHHPPSGAVAIMKKPVDVDRLLALVRRYCCP